GLRMDVIRAESFHRRNGPDVIKSTRLPVKPMSVEEAVMQMDLMSNEVLVFRNADTDALSGVYRRKDGNYGLIPPEPHWHLPGVRRSGIANGAHDEDHRNPGSGVDHPRDARLLQGRGARRARWGGREAAAVDRPGALGRDSPRTRGARIDRDWRGDRHSP